jgi:hypothetical protein
MILRYRMWHDHGRYLMERQAVAIFTGGLDERSCPLYHFPGGTWRYD